ncbi:MAG TPA: RNA polymerase sigma factor [Actinomycetota bacterium]|nr:RNA polymerase sigma factor [Actinomycetota bacterium]
MTSRPDLVLEELYREHGGRLWRALVAYAGDPDVASDAMAEAFAQALGRGAALREPMRWVWRVSFRIAAGELKDRRRRASGLSPPVTTGDEPADELVGLLSRLSPKQRAAIILHYYVGYSIGEVARVIGSSAATVRVHLSQGRKRLRRILEEEHGG